MNQSELSKVLKKCISNSYPLMIEGAPGIGKTALVEQAALSADADFMVSHPVVCDPTDASGVLWPDVAAGKAAVLPKEDLHTALTSDRPLVWLLDDFAQAAPAVQNSFAHLIHARKSGNRELPDHVTFIVACNRRTDRAGSQSVVSTIMSRCLSSVKLEPRLSDFEDWALKNGAHPAVVSYLRRRPDNLYTETPPVGEAYPCPRSWAHASNILSMDFELNSELSMLSGAVGAGAALELQASVNLMRNELNSLEALCDLEYKLPFKKPDHMCALVAGAAYYAESHPLQLIELAERLYSNKLGEYAGMLVSDSLKRFPGIQKCPKWLEFIKGPVGSFIMRC